jgi:hypothetical protein
VRAAQDAKLSCLHDAAPPRRCAGFAWRRGGRGAAGGEYTPLRFDQVSPVHRTDLRIDVYQVRPSRASPRRLALSPGRSTRAGRLTVRWWL